MSVVGTSVLVSSLAVDALIMVVKVDVLLRKAVEEEPEGKVSDHEGPVPMELPLVEVLLVEILLVDVLLVDVMLVEVLIVEVSVVEDVLAEFSAVDADEASDDAVELVLS